MASVEIYRGEPLTLRGELLCVVVRVFAVVIGWVAEGREVEEGGPVLEKVVVIGGGRGGW